MKRRNFIQAVIAIFSGSALATNNQQNNSSRKTLLLNTELAGFQYYSGESLFNQLTASQPLILKREHSNRYDSNGLKSIGARKSSGTFHDWPILTWRK
jgi:hypothetical protein